jgi:hypothetical protein
MRLESRKEGAAPKLSGRRVFGRCLCGAVELEIDFPAFWAWHDHSAASRRAHGAAYATYIGCWRKHARVAQGQRSIARFEDAKTGSTRSFCSRCGTPLLYERQRSLHMVNTPRAPCATACRGVIVPAASRPPFHRCTPKMLVAFAALDTVGSGQASARGWSKTG